MHIIIIRPVAPPSKTSVLARVLKFTGAVLAFLTVAVRAYLTWKGLPMH